MVSENEKRRRRKEIDNALAKGEAEPEPNLLERAKSTYNKAKMYYEEHKERERQRKMAKARERIGRYEKELEVSNLQKRADTMEDRLQKNREYTSERKKRKIRQAFAFLDGMRGKVNPRRTEPKQRTRQKTYGPSNAEKMLFGGKQNSKMSNLLFGGKKKKSKWLQ